MGGGIYKKGGKLANIGNHNVSSDCVSFVTHIHSFQMRGMDTPENIKFINENQSVPSKLRILKQLDMRTTPDGERELNFWDKKRWLVLEDFWAERMTKEHAEELLEQIDNQQDRKK